MEAIAFREETSSSFPVLREAHSRLERYDLRFELAHGGMATVYLAYAGSSMGVGRVAAVKVIHPHLAKERDYVDMFLDEARLASLISHPNVCGVYDFGQSGGTYFIAMEYLRGSRWAKCSVRCAGARGPSGCDRCRFWRPGSWQRRPRGCTPPMY